VLFSDIRAFTTYSERLTSDRDRGVAQCLSRDRLRAIIRCGGVIMKFIGDGVMALFEARPNQAGESHARRAVRAGLGMQLAALEFREWVRQHHPSKSLPEFSIGVGIHSGEVLLCHVGTPGRGELTVVGDSVNIAARLEDQNKELGWQWSQAKQPSTPPARAVVVGSRRTIQLRGRSTPTEAFEIIGIAAGDATMLPVQIPEDMREALAANARIAGDAAKAALGITLSIMTGEFSEKRLMIQATASPRRSVVAAPRSSTSPSGKATSSRSSSRSSTPPPAWTRSCCSASCRSSTSSRRSITRTLSGIYDRGFSDRHAYIAMEYFPDGSLLEVISKGLSARQALSLLAQPRARCVRFTAAASSTAISSRQSHGARRRQHRSRRFRHRKAARRRPGPHAARRALRDSLLRSRSRSKEAPATTQSEFTPSESSFTKC